MRGEARTQCPLASVQQHISESREHPRWHLAGVPCPFRLNQGRRFHQQPQFSVILSLQKSEVPMKSQVDSNKSRVESRVVSDKSQVRSPSRDNESRDPGEDRRLPSQVSSQDPLASSKYDFIGGGRG